MSVSFTVDNKRGSVYLFRPEDIIVKPELNGRHDDPDLTSLKDSIKEHGKIHPVLIRNENGNPVLCVGFSRWRAISELNHEQPGLNMRIACTYTRLNEQDAYVLNWSENRIRNKTTPMDDAHSFARAEAWGWTSNEIAERFGVKKSFVMSRLKLISAIRDVQKAVENGRIKPTAAVKIAQLSSEQQRRILAGEGKITARAINDAAGRPRKATLKELRVIIEEAADTADTKAVMAFARMLLAKIDGQEGE